ncbi:hypothetical protein H7271_12850 [Bittarella massiliensis]|uniref:hypothetical protein n=1 Tax=Bittarella massiliensis (ex Durand et al. 2017) TaxID=1720313 RepID=UPI00163CF517|nr:hypothetical protein [Bittarella massiliensis (ex Durand et al. 2017)]MBC2872471.1 hypothetical protein [Bittarella massiliensis (ex Durand et al. 2017)]
MAFTIRAIGYKGADIGLTTRFPTTPYDRLCALKKRTGVSLHSLLLQAVEYALDNLPEEGPPPPP